jgi:hypothetical protein
MSQALVKFSSSQLPAVLPHVNLAAEPAAVVQDAQAVAEALDKLEAAGFLTEAARLVAHALPRREAVWWACMCAAHTAPPDLPEPDRQARENAENWVRQQTDALRRAAMRGAEAGGFGTPEAWAGVAAFWSGDSMSPEGQPAVPPAPHLAGAAVAGSIVLASVRGDPAKQQARLKRFLESGRNIAAGGPGRLPPEPA